VVEHDLLGDLVRREDREFGDNERISVPGSCDIEERAEAIPSERLCRIAPVLARRNEMVAGIRRPPSYPLALSERGLSLGQARRLPYIPDDAHFFSRALDAAAHHQYDRSTVSVQQLSLSSFVSGMPRRRRWYDSCVSRALVLNASLEPLSVVSVRRALVLVLRDRADVLVANGAVWRSELVSMPSPSVVRLKRYVRVPYQRRVPVNRRTVFLRDGHRCQYCGHQAENLDHVVPRTQGGEHSWSNVVAACRRCNTKKGGRTPTEAGLVLASVPSQPHSATWVAAAVGGSVDPNWGPYITGQPSG